MTPTPEQLTILSTTNSTSSNLTINALAGTGKSSTLRMIERTCKTAPILYLAFNRKIVHDIEYKPGASPTVAAKRMTSTTSVRTFNSLGHRIWGDAIGKRQLTLDSKKVPDLLGTFINEQPRTSRGPLWNNFWAIVSAVAQAKSLGYAPHSTEWPSHTLCTRPVFHSLLDETPDDLTANAIDTILLRSIAAAYAGRIDFNDQVFMPAVFGGSYPQFPLVLVDEAQDLNPVNHHMVAKLVRSRIILVGDPYQSIYGFRGAVQNGMAALSETHRCTSLPLSTSFRCPRAIVENARWRVPNFTWIKDGGHVATLAELESSSIPEAAAILCRNNAPLLSMAMRLLSLGRSVSVAGSDIGPKLVGILRRLGTEDLSRSAVLGAIDTWLGERLAKGSTSAADLAECMRVFAHQGTDLGQAIRYAEHLFAQKGSIQLMTGHRAKGLEFETVYFLDPWLIDQTNEQDLNLRYVIETRAMQNLFYVDSRNIK